MCVCVCAYRHTTSTQFSIVFFPTILYVNTHWPNPNVCGINFFRISEWERRQEDETVETGNWTAPSLYLVGFGLFILHFKIYKKWMIELIRYYSHRHCRCFIIYCSNDFWWPMVTQHLPGSQRLWVWTSGATLSVSSSVTHSDSPHSA